MDRVKLYMRLVAVCALVVLGGVGVYKGRTMLKSGGKSAKAGKRFGKTADKTPSDTPSDTPADDVESDDKTKSKSLYGSDDEPTDEPKTGDSTGSKYGADETESADAADEESTDESTDDQGETAAPPKFGKKASAYGSDPEETADPVTEETAEEEATEESADATEDEEESSAVASANPTARRPYGSTPEEATEEATEAEASEEEPSEASDETNARDVALAPEAESEEEEEAATEEEEESTEVATAPRQEPRVDGVAARVKPSNVKIPEEPKPGVVERSTDAARSLLGAVPPPSRARPAPRYADDASSEASPATPERELPPVPPLEEEAEETEEASAPMEERSPRDAEDRVAPEETETEVETSPIERSPLAPTPRAYAPDPRESRPRPDRTTSMGRDDSSARIRTSQSSGRMAEGPQSPNVVLEKVAPPEVQVGQPAMFELIVRNLGDAPAHQVVVEEEVPEGTEYHGADPPPTRRQGKLMIWEMGTLRPDEEQAIRLDLTPVDEGEIALSAHVRFQAQADARSVATRPVLDVQVDVPERVHAGDEVPLTIVVANRGSGAAQDVTIEEDVPDGFRHARGKTLQYRVGTLPPGKSKTVTLKLTAESAGRHRNRLAVVAAGGVARKEETTIEVVAPALKLAVTGPKRKYLDAQAVHVLTLSNPGSAPAHNVEMIARLPRGLKFVSATNRGEYDSSRHAVYWDMDQLPPGGNGTAQLTTTVEDAGEHRIDAIAQAEDGATAQADFRVTADAASELPFEVSDMSDPIEVNEQTTYEVRIANRGSKDATNVVVVANFPPGIRPLKTQGDVAGRVEGAKVSFSKIDRMRPGQGVVLRVAAQAIQAGDHRVAVSVSSDDATAPVTHEEATRVYRDQ